MLTLTMTHESPSLGRIVSRTSSLAVALVMLLGLPAVAKAKTSSEDDGDGGAKTSSPPAADSVGGLRFKIEELRRELEELRGRAGAKTPTADQLAEISALEKIIEELEGELGAVSEARDERATGDSFYARWLRLRKASEDFTQYDIGDGMLRFNIGIRAQVDGTVPFATDDTLEQAEGELQSGVDVRRARVYAEGRLFRTMDFKFEYDFGADFGLKDAYLEGARFTRIFKWRIGSFKEPLSLSKQHGSFSMSFLELPLPVQAFVPGSNFGLMFRHNEANRRFFWAVSATTLGRQTDDNRNSADLSFTGRITGLPIYRRKGRRLLHLGASYSVRNPTSNTSDFSARPEARFLPFFVDTGDIAAETGQIIGLEVAAVRGPWWAQAEWLETEVESDDGTRFGFDGSYVEVGHFLTGENRLYRTRNGAFGRLIPRRTFRGGNLFRRGTDKGAFELSARFSTVDLDDGEVLGGEMRNVGFAVNWYATTAARVSFNLIHSKVEEEGSTNILLLRLQFYP